MSASVVTDSSIDGSVNLVTAASANGTGLERDNLLAVAEVVVLAVILVMALLGNSLVLVVLLRQRRRHRNPLHQFMLNLCLADLVVALFQVLPQLVWDAKGRFPGPDFLCRLVKYLQVLGMFASSYMIVAMTMDRHYAICCPLRAHRSDATQRRNHFIVVAWVLSLLLSLPQVFIFSRSEVVPGVYECWGNFAESWGLKAYVTWMTLAVFILPVLTITVCQVRIFREIHNNLYLKSDRRVSPAAPPFRRNSQRADGGGGRSGKYSLSQNVVAAFNNNPPGSTSYDPESTYQHLPMGPVTSTSITLNCDRQSFTADHSANLQQEVVSEPGVPSAVCYPMHKPPAFRDGEVSAAMSKTVKMTLVIVIVYSLCWSPFFFVQLWAAWDPNPPQNGVVFTLLMLLASLNSCTNPWIYSAFSSSISPELRLLLFCHSQSQPRCSSPNNSTATHNSNY